MDAVPGPNTFKDSYLLEDLPKLSETIRKCVQLGFLSVEEGKEWEEFIAGEGVKPASGDDENADDKNADDLIISTLPTCHRKSKEESFAEQPLHKAIKAGMDRQHRTYKVCLIYNIWLGIAYYQSEDKDFYKIYILRN